MKVTYFKLENFAGIHYGIGQQVLELKDVPSGIILLSGVNGCGKSTTLKTLHPFSDDKDYLIRNDDDSFVPASKEVKLTHNGNEYRVLHQYNSKGSKKSFIQKNGEELNANGNVSTFEDVILKEFGFENNTISNSVIGVSAINFIDLTSSKRKEEISKLLPDIAEYEKAYKVINDNTSTIKKNIQLFTKLISEQGSVESIQENINKLNEDLKPINEEIDKFKSMIEENKSEIIKRSGRISELNKNLHEFRSFLEDPKNQNELNDAINSLQNIEKVDTSVSVDELNSSLAVNENLLSENRNKREALKIELVTINNEIARFIKDSKFAETINKNKEAINNQIKNLDNVIVNVRKQLEVCSNIQLAQYENETTIELIREVGIGLKNEVESIRNVYTYAIDDRSEFDVYNDVSTNIDKINKYESVSMQYQALNNQLQMFNRLNSSVNETNNSGTQIQMNDGCSIGKCMQQYSMITEGLKQKVEQLSNFLNQHRQKYEQYKLLVDTYNRFQSMKSSRNNLLKILSDGGYDVSVFCNFDLKESSNTLSILRTLINSIAEKQQAAAKFPELSNELNRYENEKNAALEQLSSMSDFQLIPCKYSSDDVSNKENEIKSIEDAILAVEKKIHELRNRIQILNKVGRKDYYEKVIANYNEKREYEKRAVSDINLEEEANRNIQNSINQYNEVIRQRSELKNEISDKIVKLNESLSLIDNYMREKNKYESEIEVRSMILSALHPTKGIPSILVKSYLEEIERNCNEILDKAFNSTYQIALENLEKEFYIRVYERSTERYIKDVSLCSSGQQAIIKLVLSIGLIKCYVGTDTLLRLDEVDSVLSKDTLQQVEVLLNGLLSKFGIEQVFMVTHNSSISVADMSVKFDRDDQNYVVEY